MIEISQKNQKQTGRLGSLQSGTVFNYDGTFHILTDETDEYGDIRCVRIRDGQLFTYDPAATVDVAHSAKMEIDI